MNVLKQPDCAGWAQEILLRELARRAGPPATAAPAVAAAIGCPAGEVAYPDGRRPFTDRWEAAGWLRSRAFDLDLTTPLRGPITPTLTRGPGGTTASDNDLAARPTLFPKDWVTEGLTGSGSR